MRKSFISICVVFVLSLFSVIYVSSSITDEMKNVVFKEISHTGDYKYLEGITVCQDISENNILWKTETHMGEKPITVTTVEKTKNDYVNRYYMKTNRNVLLHHYYSDDEYYMDKDEKSNNIYIDMIENQENTREYSLNEFLDYYPFANNSELWGISIYNYNANITDNVLFINEGEYIRSELANQFKIPVIDAEKVNVTVEKNNDEGYMGHMHIDEEKEYFPFITVFDIDGDNCYFTFDTHTTKDNIVDTSYLEHGYGIYKLKKQDNKILVEDIERIIALDPDIKIYSLKISDNNIFLLYEYEKEINVDVIDKEKGVLLQTIEIGKDFGENAELFVYEDLVYLESATKFYAIIKDKNIYKSELVDEYIRTNKEHRDIIYDDEKIVIVYSKPKETEEYYTGGHHISDCPGPDFSILVYDKGQLVFEGEYTCSLMIEYPYEEIGYYTVLKVMAD